MHLQASTDLIIAFIVEGVTVRCPMLLSTSYVYDAPYAKDQTLSYASPICVAAGGTVCLS